MAQKEKNEQSEIQGAKKRVLIFSLVYYPKHVHGGAEVALKEITDRIKKEDIEFHMVTLGYDSELPKISWEGNVLVHRIGLMKKGTEVAEFDIFPLFLNKYLFQFLATWKAHHLHKQYKYDATWAMMAHATGVPAALFKFFHPKVPYILTLQEGDPIEKIERAVRPLWPLFKRAFTTADVVQVISSFLGKWAKSRDFKGEPILIPNGVNVAHFSKRQSEDIQKAREELGKQNGDVFLVTTSRLFKKNGLDDVVRALPLLPPHVHFIVFGEGPEQQPLERLAKELNVADRIQFRGLIGHDVMPSYLHACDIFIRPSRSEGMGNAFVEAMAAGLPVIATQEGGIADFLFDEVRNPDKKTTGWAVDVNAPEQIKDAVLEIIQNPEKTTAVLQNARELVTQKYEWNLVAKEMQARVFNPVLEKDTAPDAKEIKTKTDMFTKVSATEWENACVKKGIGSALLSPQWEEKVSREIPFVEYEHYRYSDSHLVRLARIDGKYTTAPFGEGGDVISFGNTSLNLKQFETDVRTQFGDGVRLRVNERFAPVIHGEEVSATAHEYVVSLTEPILPRVRKTLRHTLSRKVSGEIQQTSDPTHIDLAYELYLRHMRSVRNFALPKNLFVSLIHDCGGELWAWSSGIGLDAMAVFIPSETEVLYSLSAGNKRALKAEAPHHLVYTALLEYQRRGITHASLGATGVGSALEVFKRGWRGEHYVIYELGKRAHKVGRTSPVRNLVRFVPLALYPSLTRLIGKYVL